MERRGEPVALRIVAHQMRAARIRGDGVVAGEQRIRDLRRALVAPVAPLPACLPHQAVYNIQRWVQDAAQIGQHVGHPHQVMVIAAHLALRLRRHEAKEVLERHRHTHKGVVLQLGHGDELVHV